MIYAPGRFLFVHIPRCAGNAVATACGSLVPDGELIISTLAMPRGILPARHARVVEMRRFLADFNSIWRWTIVRSPWDLIASDYRLTWRAADHASNGPPVWEKTGPWRDRLVRFEESERSFEAFISREFEFLRYPGGFFRYWCCDDGEPLCEAIRYEQLHEAWPAIRARLDPSGALLAEVLPRVNAGAKVITPWTTALIDYVGELCRDDIDRFGFEPPTIQ